MTKIAHLDYETRSLADLTEVGAHRYAIDPSFEILMACVSLEGSDKKHLWINPAFPWPSWLPDENQIAEEILAEADEIHAHNASFEQACTWGAAVQGKASPLEANWEATMNKWRCTAVMARRAGLPYHLAGIGEALKLNVQKDPRGKKLIELFSMPQKDGTFIDPASRSEEWSDFCKYCIRDVEVEKLVDTKLKFFGLTGGQLAAFQFDLRLNQRGIPINVDGARKAQTLIDQVNAGVTDEFRKLTGLNPTQREKVKQLVTDLGIPMSDMQGDTITATLASTLESKDANVVKARRILTLYATLGFSAVKKVQTMLDCVCPDGRVRGGHFFYGAGTGRWSGRLIQPQNFRKTDPEFRPLVDLLYASICEGMSVDGLEAIFGNPLECIANVIRCFIHGPVPILGGDYSGIEARLNAWLSGQDDAVQEWVDYDNKKSRGPYVSMAAEIYGIPTEQVTQDQRQFGKVVILGAGYQMGAETFQEQAKTSYGLDLPLELCVQGIKAFRRKHDKIVAYWHLCDDNCRKAIRSPGATFGDFTVRVIAGIPFLLIRLRSGRYLAYPYPALEKREPTKKEAEEMKKGKEYPAERFIQITYWGQIPGKSIWGRIKLYGGKIVENIVQATAADVMAAGGIEAERRGMEPFMLVHDEAEALNEINATPEEFDAALATLPKWADGFPVRVESKIMPYYKKF